MLCSYRSAGLRPATPAPDLWFLRLMLLSTLTAMQGCVSAHVACLQAIDRTGTDGGCSGDAAINKQCGAVAAATASCQLRVLHTVMPAQSRCCKRLELLQRHTFQRAGQGPDPSICGAAACGGSAACAGRRQAHRQPGGCNPRAACHAGSPAGRLQRPRGDPA